MTKQKNNTSKGIGFNGNTFYLIVAIAMGAAIAP
jgi:hypothetical protein